MARMLEHATEQMSELPMVHKLELEKECKLEFWKVQLLEHATEQMTALPMVHKLELEKE